VGETTRIDKKGMVVKQAMMVLCWLFVIVVQIFDTFQVAEH